MTQHTTTFPLHTIDTAPLAAQATLQAIEDTEGFVPNLAGLLADAPAALSGLLDMLGAFDRTSLTARERQVVLLAASVENDCHYCSAAHSLDSARTGLDGDMRDAIRQRRPLADARLEALRAVTSALVRRRGYLPDGALQDFLAAGFTTAQLLELSLGVACKTLTNYINHVAATPVDRPYLTHAYQPRSQAGA